jgi:hypothetical protein
LRSWSFPIISSSAKQGVRGGQAQVTTRSRGSGRERAVNYYKGFVISQLLSGGIL